MIEKIKKTSSALKEPKWMLQKRLESLEISKALKTPKFFNYGSGIKTEIGTGLEGLETSKPVFKSEVSKDERVEVMTIEQAGKKIPEELKKKIFSSYNNKDKFLALHKALANSITVIHVKKDTNIEKDFFIETILEKGSLFRHVVIIMEENSCITIIDSKKASNESSKKPKFFSNVVEIFSKPNSSINFVCTSDLKDAYGFSKKTASAQKDSCINFQECILGGRFLKTETQNFLLEQGSQGFISGFFVSSENDVLDIKTDSLHVAKNTKSNILVKGVVDEKSKSVYRGFVKIFPNSQQSNGFQKQDTLLLSKDAIVSSIPNLEIATNDVKCSHGATTGQVDPSQLFYLMSRGLSKKESAKIIIQGFLSPVIEKIQNKKLKQKIFLSAIKKIRSY